ncbi:MAG: hypothetical protein GY816_01525 [Cytophagales bacterium]|nr:hypothetical protein [Cytophagales bacterium]
MLSDQLGSFTANEPGESRVIDDGSTRVTRSYTSGEKTLSFKVGIPKTKEEFQSVKSEINEVEDMFQEMADDGKMEMESIQAGEATGFITFTEGRGRASGFVMAQDEYLIEINVSGATVIEDIRNVYKALDFSILGGSGTNKSNAQTSSKSKVEAKATTAAEKKMANMLSDAFGSFKATGDTKTGNSSDGISQVFRSYESGNKSFKLKIELLVAEGKAQKEKRIRKLREKYQEAELIRIDKEKLKGNLVYLSDTKTGLIYLMVRGQHWMVGTINNASGIEDVKSIYQSFDYSLLK